jgi:hypothetical protein
MDIINENPQFDPNTIPSSQEIDDFISELSTANLGNVHYPALYKRLSDFLMPFPIFQSTWSKGSRIERAREHTVKGSPYKCEKEISYKADPFSIKGFGRANEPQQSTFYGAIDTAETKHARVTLLHEIHSDFRNKKLDEFETSYMTIGQWVTNQPLNLVEIIFHEEARLQSERIRALYTHHEAKFRPILGERYEDVMKVMQFISGQFAKNVVGDSTGYMISAAYYNFVVERSNGRIHGVIYPSVQTNFQGANIALPPYYAMMALKLNIAIEIEIKQTGEKEFLVDIPKICREFGPLNSNFKWLDAKYDSGTSGIVTFTPSTEK